VRLGKTPHRRSRPAATPAAPAPFTLPYGGDGAAPATKHVAWGLRTTALSSGSISCTRVPPQVEGRLPVAGDQKPPAGTGNAECLFSPTWPESCTSLAGEQRHERVDIAKRRLPIRAIAIDVAVLPRAIRVRGLPQREVRQVQHERVDVAEADRAVAVQVTGRIVIVPGLFNRMTTFPDRLPSLANEPLIATRSCWASPLRSAATTATGSLPASRSLAGAKAS